MFAHVLLLGRTSFQKLRLGLGLNPRAGFHLHPSRISTKQVELFGTD